MHEEFEERQDEFVERFGGREPPGTARMKGKAEKRSGDFAFVEYVGADAVLQGMEAHADFQLTPQLSAELGLDFVRGTLKDGDLPLPRIPPLFRGGLRYQRNAFQWRGGRWSPRGRIACRRMRRRPTATRC